MTWGMDPDSLYEAGTRISGYADGGRQAAKGFLRAVTDAGSAVHQADLVAAFGRFHSTWSKPANSLGPAVTSAGQANSKAAKTGRDANNESAALQRSQLNENDSLKLRRPINAR